MAALGNDFPVVSQYTPSENQISYQQQFTGSGAESANQLLKREYRKGYEVPEFPVSSNS